jgi:hypothetical protein
MHVNISAGLFVIAQSWKQYSNRCMVKQIGTSITWNTIHQQKGMNY